MNLEKWPPVAGRYYIGNKNSCAAVCTLASVDLMEAFNNQKYLEKVALAGKDVTENVGIEKIIQNTLTNPNIRFLILCGKESSGHHVGQALKALAESGIDEKMRIIGAVGPLPTVKNLPKEQVEEFRKQVKVIDMIGEENIEKVMNAVAECEKNNPGPYKLMIEMKIEEPPTLQADYDPTKQWTIDEKPDEHWFTISIDRDKKVIVVEVYKGYGVESKILCRVVGTRAEQIAGTIVMKKFLQGAYHATYLGKELARAEISLKYNLPYEPESEYKIEQLEKKEEGEGLKIY